MLFLYDKTKQTTISELMETETPTCLLQEQIQEEEEEQEEVEEQQEEEQAQ